MTRTNWITWLGAMASIGALGAGQAGCTNVDCGTGTINKDGTCQPSSNQFGDTACGDGTHVGPSGKCEPDQNVMCDPGTTTAETDPVTHITTCVGTGTTGCGGPISCPKASSGKQTICGQLVDLETSTPIVGAATGQACDPNNPTADGPCAMVMEPYNAIQFAGDPTHASPLANDEIVIDDCGRFRIKNVAVSGVQFVGIGIDDNPKAPATDMHRLTGVALPAKGAETDTGFTAFSMKVSTDMTWSGLAGFATGNSFADRGVYVGIFLHGMAPVAGVTVTRAGAPSPSDDYYFTDASPATRSMLSTTASKTGANGTALLINSSGLTTYSGTGSEPSGCEWNPNLDGAEIMGAAFVEPQQAVKTSDGTTICP